MTKPALKLDNLNIWVNCQVQVINETTMKWDTLAEVLDTPNAIKKYMRENNLKSVWVKRITGREFIQI